MRAAGLALGLLLCAVHAEDSAKLMERLDVIAAESDRIRNKAEPAAAELAALQPHYAQDCGDPVLVAKREELRRALSLAHDEIEARKREFRRLQESLQYRVLAAEGLRALKERDAQRMGVPLVKMFAYEAQFEPIRDANTRIFQALQADAESFRDAVEKARARRRRRLAAAGVCLAAACLAGLLYRRLQRA